MHTMMMKQTKRHTERQTDNESEVRAYRDVSACCWLSHDNDRKPELDSSMPAWWLLPNCSICRDTEPVVSWSNPTTERRDLPQI